MQEEPEVPLKQPIAIQLKQGEDYYYAARWDGGVDREEIAWNKRVSRFFQ